MNDPVDTTTRNRNRWILVAIVAIFLVPAIGAGLLRFADIHPPVTKQEGELLSPKPDLRQVVPVDVGGRPYEWKAHPRTWRILAMPRDCAGAQATACAQLLADIDKVWQLAGKDADRVHVLWVGALPQGGPRPATLQVLRPSDTLRDGLPRSTDAAGIPVYLLDPNGFVVLRYAPPFDPSGLRKDLSRLLKVN